MGLWDLVRTGQTVSFMLACGGLRPQGGQADRATVGIRGAPAKLADDCVGHRILCLWNVAGALGLLGGMDPLADR